MSSLPCHGTAKAVYLGEVEPRAENVYGNLVASLVQYEKKPLEPLGEERELILDAAGEQVRALLNEGEQLLELDRIDPGLSAEEWLVLRLRQSGDDCNLLWEYETLDIDIRIEDENDRRIDRVFRGQTATAKGETNPPGKTLTWSIAKKTKGVDTEIEADSGIITVKPNSGKGWIVVRASHGDSFRDAAVYAGCMSCKDCDKAAGGFVTLYIGYPAMVCQLRPQGRNARTTGFRSADRDPRPIALSTDSDGCSGPAL